MRLLFTNAIGTGEKFRQLLFVAYVLRTIFILFVVNNIRFFDEIVFFHSTY